MAENNTQAIGTTQAPDRLWKMVPDPTLPYRNKDKHPGGRPRRFQNASQLWESAKGYFMWVDANPWTNKDGSNVRSDNGASTTNSARQSVRVLARPYTLYGLCAYCGIHSKWCDFRRTYTDENDENRAADAEEFLAVIRTIEHIITSQQVDGAMLRQYDSNLVARLNGISDIVEQRVSGELQGGLRLPKLSKSDLEELAHINDELG